MQRTYQASRERGATKYTAFSDRRFERLDSIGFRWNNPDYRGKHLKVIKDRMDAGESLATIVRSETTQNGDKNLMDWKRHMEIRYDGYCRGKRGTMSGQTFHRYTQMGFKYTASTKPQDLMLLFEKYPEMSMDEERSHISSILVAQGCCDHPTLMTGEDFVKIVDRKNLPFIHPNAARTLLNHGIKLIPEGQQQALRDLILRCSYLTEGEQFSVIAGTLVSQKVQINGLTQERDNAVAHRAEIQQANDTHQAKIKLLQSQVAVLARKLAEEREGNEAIRLKLDEQGGKIRTLNRETTKLGSAKAQRQARKATLRYRRNRQKEQRSTVGHTCNDLDET